MAGYSPPLYSSLFVAILCIHVAKVFETVNTRVAFQITEVQVRSKLLLASRQELCKRIRALRNVRPLSLSNSNYRIEIKPGAIAVGTTNNSLLAEPTGVSFCFQTQPNPMAIKRSCTNFLQGCTHDIRRAIAHFIVMVMCGIQSLQGNFECPNPSRQKQP